MKTLRIFVHSTSFRAQASALCLLLLTSLSADPRNSIAAEAERPAPAQPLPPEPVRQALERLAAAQSLLEAGKLDQAKQAFEQISRLPGVPPHLRWEAEQRLTEIQRRQSGLPPVDPNVTRTHLKDVAGTGTEIHVAPTGDDANPGTAEKPLASLAAARDKVRAFKRSGANGPFVVWIHGGQYAVTSTFTLGSEDSGTEAAPVIYRAVKGDTPRFTGGKRLNDFKSVTDPEVLRRLPAGVAKSVVEVDLRSAGITNLLPLELGGFASGRGFRTHPLNELFFNGEPLRIARGPNEGFLRIADVAVKDGTKGYDREGSKIGRFYYRGDEPARWAEEPDLLLYGYWFWDWADSYEKVAKIEADKRLITLAEPFHTYGYSINAPFYAVNALCELDRPGEYVIERKASRLFFYPPAGTTGADVELSLFAEPMVKLDNAAWVRFEGLTWELGSADAIHVSGGSHCTFAGCVVRNFAGTGVEMSGGTAHGLLSCDIYNLGRGGVIMRAGDRKTLAPGGDFVENCDIHDLSRIDHTYTPAVALGGVGNRIAHNRFHEVLSSALNVGGNDHVVEYNEVFHVVLESDDQGGVDMFGDPTARGNIYRYNYWHHIGNWRAVGEQPKCGQAGVRLDDAISGTLVYGNIFERCSTGKTGFGGVQIHGGKDNIIDNNLFIDCAAAVSFSPWEPKRWREFVAPAMTNSQIDAKLYLERYPALATLSEDANRNAVYRNVLVRCGELLRHPARNDEAMDNTMLPDADTTLKASNPLFHRAGFSPIPVEQIGLYQDAYRTHLPKPGP